MKLTVPLPTTLTARKTLQKTTARNRLQLPTNRYKRYRPGFLFYVSIVCPCRSFHRSILSFNLQEGKNDTDGSWSDDSTYDVAPVKMKVYEKKLSPVKEEQTMSNSETTDQTPNPQKLLAEVKF